MNAPAPRWISSISPLFLRISACFPALLIPAIIGANLRLTSPAHAQDNALDISAMTADASPDIPDVPREFRAAWIATVANIDWPSKPGLSTADQQKEMLALLDLADDLNLNAVVFQVRPHADAMYDSKIEPWSYYLTAKQGQAPKPHYDPLAFTVEQAHQRGIEVHVWFNPYRALHPKNPRGKNDLAKNHVSNTMPDAVKKLGKDQGVWWMDPADPRVQNQSLDVIADVLDRYDVDGIHFDDYFYPYPSYNDGQDFPDDPTWKKYQAAGGRLNRADWRRKAVNDFVQNLHALIQQKKPHVKLGISPFGIYRPGHPDYIQGFDQYEKLFADAHLWLERGWVDYMTPQLYWEIRKPDQSFTGLLSWWNDHNPQGRHIWPGLYTSRLLEEKPSFDDQEIPAQIDFTRVLTQPSAGHVHFSIKALQQNARNLATTLKKKHYAHDALVPASPWLSDAPPNAPAFTAKRTKHAVKIQRTDNAPNDTQEKLPGGLTWVVQLGVAGQWTHAVIPATQKTITLDFPALPKPEGKDAKPTNPANLPITAAVFTLNRAGVASEKTIQTLQP